MTFLRPALPADSEELARFECARNERQFEIDVQDFVRDAIGWQEDSEGVDREVLVLEDDAGEIIGIVMHEDDAAIDSSTRWRFETTNKHGDSASSYSGPSSTIYPSGTQIVWLHGLSFPPTSRLTRCPRRSART